MFKLAVFALFAGTFAVAKWPPWLSIEAPVNPYDSATHGAVMLVHADFRDGNTQLTDLAGTAEGLVNGARRSIPLHFDSTSHLNVFGLKRQWPTEGAWVLRISLKTTTVVVTMDRNGNVASATVPTTSSSGVPLPRAVSSRDIDSILSGAGRP